jgi:hypothetical protein
MHSLRIQVGSIEYNLVIDHSTINQQSAWSNMMVDYIPIAEISSVTFEVAQKPSSEDTVWRKASSRTQVAFSLLRSPYFHRVLSYQLCPQHLIENSKHDFWMCCFCICAVGVHYFLS